MDNADTIIDSALSLPRDRRVDLANRLLEGLAAQRETPDAFSEEFAAEVQRRSAEMDSGEVEGVSWAEIRDGIDKRLGGDKEA